MPFEPAGLVAGRVEPLGGDRPLAHAEDRQSVVHALGQSVARWRWTRVAISSRRPADGLDVAGGRAVRHDGPVSLALMATAARLPPADGVHPQQVAALVEPGHVAGVLHHAGAAERVEGLVLGTVDLPAGLGSFGQRQALAAAQRARRAAVILDGGPLRSSARPRGCPRWGATPLVKKSVGKAPASLTRPTMTGVP